MMRFSTSLLPITLFALTLCVGFHSSANADEGQAYTLRYQFHQGQVIRYEESLRDDYVIQVQEEVDEPFSYQTSGKSMKVIEVLEDGSAIADLQINWVTIKIRENGEEETFDSRTGEEPSVKFLALAQIIGRPRMRVKITTTGEVLEAESLLGDGGKPDPSTVEVLRRLPEQPVSVGEVWKEDAFIELALPDSQLKKKVRLQDRFKFVSVEDGVASIELETVVITPVDSAELQMQLLRRQPAGTYQIHLERGELLGFELNQNNEVPGFTNRPSKLTFRQKHTQRILPVQLSGGNDSTFR
ncbi:hypothetical protein AB1L42_11075 [Thalassoglobus sp. JC818]|uniref:hypothetical protein n=1 Tax=Thalassoglobus sp. JC818 TaxID=3232136 RepID=UPI003458CB6F